MKIAQHLKACYYFYVVAQQLSIKQAAAQLYVTQAAVSQQIRQLEQALGVSLLVRKHRAIELSAEGAQLLPYLSTAFASMERGVTQLLGDTSPNVITLTALPSFASRWLIPRLGRFYQAHPETTVNLTMSDRLETFASPGVDLALRFGEGEYTGLASQFLMNDYLYPVCNPTFAEAERINSVADLRRVRLLDDVALPTSWELWFELQGIAPAEMPARVRYDGSHYVLESALSGQGVAMVRHSLAAEAVTQGNLIVLFGEPMLLDYRYVLCAPDHHFVWPKVKQFVHWLQEEVATFAADHSFGAIKVDRQR